MAYEQKDNSGAMFVNDRKEKDSHPDRRGEAMIDGKMYWVSGWIKDGKKGKWMSLGLEPKDAANKPAPVRQEQSSYAEELDDEIPF